MKTPGFQGLTEIANLDDLQVRSLVLGNWRKLNKVLMSEPEIGSLRRLMVVELSGNARPDILVRLRSALSKANGKEAKRAMDRIIADLKSKTELSTFDMSMLGLIGGEPVVVNIARKKAAGVKKR